MLRTDALDYHLPPELIATHPARPRDSARLMVVPRAQGPAQHRTVRDLPDLLRAGDLLILNSTRVLPARFRGQREDSGGKVDGLYLSQAPTGSTEPVRWTVLLKSRRTAPGVRIRLHDRDDRPTQLSLQLLDRLPGQHGEDTGAWIVEPLGTSRPAPEVLQDIGLTPLPPYIRQARKGRADQGNDDEDRLDYQTVFAHDGAAGPVEGSVAAPTAGLHFTPELLAALRARAIQTAEVTLHVGTGTFKPLETELVEQHPIHAEWCSIPADTARAIHEIRARGGRVIAVGTTSARTLESFPDAAGPAADWTRLLVTPGYRWRVVDGLLTNFHLPRSTLMALVAAMLGSDPAAVERLKSLYHEAIERRYRFYSFGDAMLII